MKIIKDLVSSRSEDGKISHTKFWSNIGMAAMTANFIYMGIYNNLTEWYAWIYAMVVVAPNLASKLITLRWGNSIEVNNETVQDKQEK